MAAVTLLLGVVILAAGRSRRMGHPKMLLPWDDTSVLGHLVRQWRSLEAQQIAVVLARDDADVRRELDSLEFSAGNRIFNPEPERGMFSSVQCAAAWSGWDARLSHWVIVLGDQPHLREETLKRLLEFSVARPTQVCQPAYRGHAGHPVVLPREVFAQLSQAQGPDMKAFLSGRSVALCEADDPGLELDIDRADDYERALAMKRHREQES